MNKSSTKLKKSPETTLSHALVVLQQESTKRIELQNKITKLQDELREKSREYTNSTKELVKAISEVWETIKSKLTEEQVASLEGLYPELNNQIVKENKNGK